MGGIKILLIFWLLEDNCLFRDHLILRQLSNLVGTIPILTGQNSECFRAFFRGLVGVIRAFRDPVAQLLLFLNRSVERGYRFVCFFVGRVVLKYLLIGRNSFAGYVLVFRTVNAGIVLWMD